MANPQPSRDPEGQPGVNPTHLEGADDTRELRVQRQLEREPDRYPADGTCKAERQRLGEYHDRDGAVLESKGLHDGQLRHALAKCQRADVRRQQEHREEDGGEDQGRDEADVSKPVRELTAQFILGQRTCRVGRVLEAAIDGIDDCFRVDAVVQASYDPADLVLRPVCDRLVEVVVAEQKPWLETAFGRHAVGPRDLELPVPRSVRPRPDVADDRNEVAGSPTVLLGHRIGNDHRPTRCLEPGEDVVRNHELGKDPEIGRAHV